MKRITEKMSKIEFLSAALGVALVVLVALLVVFGERQAYDRQIAIERAAAGAQVGVDLAEQIGSITK